MNEDLFNFEQPRFDCVGLELFDGVKRIYSHQIVNAAQDIATSYPNDCVQLSNLIMPELWIILGRQPQDYCISEIYQPQYAAENQAANVDDIPVINIAMEQVCGLVYYHLQKLK